VYLFLGGNSTVKKDDVIGIFDIEECSVSRITADFLNLLLLNLRFWLRLRLHILLYRTWSWNFLHRLCLGIGLSQVDAETSKCIEVPVRIASLL